MEAQEAIFDLIEELFEQWLESEDFEENPYMNYVAGSLDCHFMIDPESLLSDSNAVDIINQANETLASIREHVVETDLDNHTMTVSCQHMVNIITLLNAFTGVDENSVDFKGHLVYNEKTRH